MARPQTPRRAAGKSLATAGKTYPRSSLRTHAKAIVEASSDEESDEGDYDDNEEQNDSNEDDEEEEDESEPENTALSSHYPFEFGDDGSLTGTDDEMELDLIRPTSKEGLEFEKSMALADQHAASGAADSDNDDYDGVNAISDDEENEEESEVDVLREAERDLIAEFEQTEYQRPAQPPSMEEAQRRFSLAMSDDPFAYAPGVNMNEDPFQGAAFMDETWGTLWETAELGIWRKPGADNEPHPRSSRQKRVRFQEASAANAQPEEQSSSGSSDEDEEEDQQFPDIFMDQADPKIQQLLANEDAETEWNGLSTNGSDAESVYDFEDDADRVAFELDEDSDSDIADASSESEDDGDETEDETVEEQQAKMQQFRKAMRQAAAATPKASTPRAEDMTPKSSTVKKTPTRFITPKSSKGPQQGTFLCDPTKATLTTDSSTRKTILYPPTQLTAQNKAFWERAKSASKLDDGSPRPVMTLPAQGKDDPSQRPFTARATLASMFDGRMDVFDDMTTPQTQPFPRFVPSFTSSLSYNSVDDGSDMDAEYPAEFSNILNMDQFQEDSSDEEMQTPNGVQDGMPAFLAGGVVGSFRLNQHRAKVESSLPMNPAKRNAAAEHNALQSGRRAAGNAPITPARKRRTGSQDLYRTGSGVRKQTPAPYGSPIAGRRRAHSRGQSLSGRLEQTLTPEMWKKI